MSRIAVFASGNGSNFQALVDHERGGTASYEVALLVCDRPTAYVIERANMLGIPVFSFSPKNFRDKAEYEAQVALQLKQNRIEWVVLAGYMRLVGPTLLNAYGGRIINLHPSLLPAFPGKDGIGDAYHYGVKITGVTVHFVDEGLDTGPIIAQQAITINEDDQLEDVKKKIHSLEHQLLPAVVDRLVQG